MDRTIFIAVILVYAVVAVLWRLRKRNEAPTTTKDVTTHKALETIDTTPDKPVNFGYKNSWLAVRASDSKGVIESLAIDNLQLANWHTGFVAAYNGQAFVSPPVNGWVFGNQEMR